MFESGLLLLTSSALRLASVSSLLRRCSEVVRSNLYVHLISSADCLKSHSVANDVPYSRHVLRFINEFYSRSANECAFSDLSFVIFNITGSDRRNVSKYSLDKTYQVVLTDVNEEFHEVLKKYLKTYFPKSQPIGNDALSIMPINQLLSAKSRNNDYINGLDEPLLPQYDAVCLGGTFDRLHVGHKILLTQACLMATEKLIVGATHGKMNEKKVLRELMETTEERICKVKEFLQDIKQSLEYQVVPIEDPYGPSISDASIGAIAVSEETMMGAESINKQRTEMGLRPLEVEVIHIINNDNIQDGDEKKISSTTIRKRLLGTLLKKPEVKSLQRRPYLIGLTGCIASGKTSISRRLEGLGAAIINCDVLGHQTYEPGTETFKRVVEVFGSKVVDKFGKIDRGELGKIVFGKKENLLQLNSIVWPAIMDLVHQQVDNFAKQGKEIVVIDAAVLLEAGWDECVHEVWTAIIPADEAERRILERNVNLTREQARERIQSQMSNEDRIKRSNVVLCTLWEYEVTQKQVEKAWKLLYERLSG